MDETHIDRDKAERISELLFELWPLIGRKLLPSSGSQGFNMPHSHIRVLMMLEMEGTMSVTQISERFGIAKPNITPLVDRLMSEGLVERVKYEKDKRIVNIVLCDAGRKRLAGIREGISNRLSEWVLRIKPCDADEFISALETVLRVVATK